MRKKVVKTNIKGQSIFEVVLALGVITAISIGIVSLTVNSIRNASFSKYKTLAGRYAQEATEWLRSQRDTDFDEFQTNALVSPEIPKCFSGLDWTGRVGSCNEEDKIAGTPLFRVIVFNSTTISGKTVIEADVKVYWNDSQGYHEVNSATTFTDWRQK